VLSPGQIIGERYEVLDLIGEGGLAQVWKVRHRELGSMHALKLLLFRNKPRLAERLILEGRIQAQLRHANLVSVTDVVRHGGQVGLVMEFVDGVPLSTWIDANAPLSPDAALEILAPVMAAVRLAHDAGVLHRDLKPANILLARDGRGIVPKVTDFGIAKVVEGSYDAVETRTGAVMGTPGYLAPEQAVDASTVDVRADLFALSAILYELLTGRRAYEGLNMTEMPADTRLHTLRPDLPAALSDAVQKALSIRPDDRYPDLVTFAAALMADRPHLLDVVRMASPAREALALNLPSGGGADPRPTLAPRTAVIEPTIEPPPPPVEPPPPPPAEPEPPPPPRASRGLWFVAAAFGMVAVGSVLALAALTWPDAELPTLYHLAGPPPPPDDADADALPSAGAGWRHPGRAAADDSDDLPKKDKRDRAKADDTDEE